MNAHDTCMNFSLRICMKMLVCGLMNSCTIKPSYVGFSDSEVVVTVRYQMMCQSHGQWLESKRVRERSRWLWSDDGVNWAKSLDSFIMCLYHERGKRRRRKRAAFTGGDSDDVTQLPSGNNCGKSGGMKACLLHSDGNRRHRHTWSDGLGCSDCGFLSLSFSLWLYLSLSLSSSNAMKSWRVAQANYRRISTTARYRHQRYYQQPPSTSLQKIIFHWHVVLRYRLQLIHILTHGWVEKFIHRQIERERETESESTIA